MKTRGIDENVRHGGVGSRRIGGVFRARRRRQAAADEAAVRLSAARHVDLRRRRRIVLPDRHDRDIPPGGKPTKGIRVWKSADLKTWEPLGLVWKIEQGTWQKVKHGDDRALWAPEIHYIKGTYWLTLLHELRRHRAC